MTAVEVEPLEEWEPGIELYSRSAHPHSQYVFNFRDDGDADTLPRTSEITVRRIGDPK